MDSDASILFPLLLLVALIALSSFFSASETAMMAVNRYRLRYLIEQGNKNAARVEKLLEEPDRLLGLILLGNNLVNMAAASVATLIALRLYGESAIAVATLIVTILVLVIAEIPPKTFAATHPERIALRASAPLSILAKIARPLITVVNFGGNMLLKLLGVSRTGHKDVLSLEELRVAVRESGAHLPERYASMLMRLLDMSNLSVEDVMLPRQEIEGIDISDDIDDIITAIRNARHLYLPLFNESLDEIIGTINVRRVTDYLLDHREMDHDTLRSLATDAYFIPESTNVTEQIRAFQSRGERIAFAVDEYGVVQGLVTMTLIISEVLGDDEATILPHDRDIRDDPDGEHLLVDASITIRDFNRSLGFRLPTDGPKTLNGLILETYEAIPNSGDRIIIDGITFDVTSVNSVQVERLRINKKELT